MLEHEIQSKILNKLISLGIFAYRNNSGATTGEYKGKKRYIQFGTPGAPDIIAIIQGKFIGIEVKRPGGKQSDYQQAFQQNLEAAGGIYILATSWENVEKIITKIL